MNRLGLALLLIFSVPALAAEPSGPIQFKDEQGRPIDTIHVPPRSPVLFAGWLKGAAPTAQFSGRFLLSGTYYYGAAAKKDVRDFVGQARIVPDPNVQLPQFSQRSAQRVIEIDNPESFAQAVIPASVLQTLRRKGGGFASGHVSVRVDGLNLGIACDRPSYGTHFLSLYTPAGAFIENAAPQTGC
jgi:hypothetical protein